MHIYKSHHASATKGVRAKQKSLFNKIKLGVILVLFISSNRGEETWGTEVFKKKENMLVFLYTCFILKEKMTECQIVVSEDVFCVVSSIVLCILLTHFWALELTCLGSQPLEILFLSINCIWPSKLGVVPSLDPCSYKASTFQVGLTVDN